eukprot:GHVP01013174.1.p1 GENE.GHVP01013174.1~~GHVP01013174.1.p1  ORF type:complete len:527 (+),score=67.82 GHVP01013174.1:247-1827(+)
MFWKRPTPETGVASMENSQCIEAPPNALTINTSPTMEGNNFGYDDEQQNNDDEQNNDEVQQPVHLGTLSLSTEVTRQSLNEASLRHTLSLTNKQKIDGYQLWLSTMLELKKIKQVHQTDVAYYGPAVLVPKPNLSIRVTHDYSGLKKFTSLFYFDQTKIENIWTWAATKKYLVKLDFIKAFHAVQIDEKDMKYYGFLGPEGKSYVYTVLPMGTRNSPALFSEFVRKSLQDLMLQYPDEIRYYQDDVAIGSSTPDETIRLAKLASNLLRIDGLVENSEKSFWNPVEAKPLLGSIWTPNRISQKPEAINKLQELHDLWRQKRTLKSRQKYLGKLASLSNFPGLIATLADNERRHGPESTSIKILQQLSTTTPDTWMAIPEGIMYVDAADGGTGAILETADGKTVKTITNQNKLHLPIFELEWVALWKGVTKFLSTMKKFKMTTVTILSDNMTVVNAFEKNKKPESPTSDYYLNKIRTFMAKENISFSVKYVPTDSNKADYYSRDTNGFSKSSWIKWREKQETIRNAQK